MSRLVINSLQFSLGQLKLSSNLFVNKLRESPCVQCVRCYRPRKPFWLPKAKSKMFRFYVKPDIPEEERIELSRLYNVYKTNMKSLRLYFKEQLLSQTTAPEVIEERKQREAQQHARCIEENNLWNAEVAKIREKRLTKEATEREENILQKLMEHEKEQKLLLEEINSKVRREKEASKTFITPDNIDRAIETALSTEVDHNFCIDLEGNIYHGRYGKPQPKNKTLLQSSTEAEKMEARN